MTGFAIVRSEIYGRVNEGDLYLAGEQRKNLLPNIIGGFSHLMEYYVSPVKGIYDTHKLNDFMHSLITMLKPCCFEYKEFSHDAKGMDCGLIVRTEAIYPTELESLIKEAERKSGQLITLDKGKEYMEKITVKVFPNKKIADEFYNQMIPSNGSCRLTYNELMKLVPLPQYLHMLSEKNHQ